MHLLEEKLKACQAPYEVINLSRSGDTTREGLQKLPKALKDEQPNLVIVELGGNDGLRGLPILSVQSNLKKIIEIIQKDKAQILLLGMRLPPNYGQGYTDQFHAIYVKLAKDKDLAFFPFMLDNIALNEELMQKDGIHPKAEAQPQLLEEIWAYLAPLLKELPAGCCTLPPCSKR